MRCFVNGESGGEGRAATESGRAVGCSTPTDQPCFRASRSGDSGVLEFEELRVELVERSRAEVSKERLRSREAWTRANQAHYFDDLSRRRVTVRGAEHEGDEHPSSSVPVASGDGVV